MSLLVLRMGADPDIVEHRKVGEQRHVLEGAADADFGDPVRRPRQDALAFHQDVARARLVEPAQAIEERGLAGAVRADQAEDLALMHVERHAIQRNDAAEHDADVANRKQRRCFPAPFGPASSRPAPLTHRAGTTTPICGITTAKAIGSPQPHAQLSLLLSTSCFLLFLIAGPRPRALPRCSLPSPKDAVQCRCAAGPP